jgi:hypothetical protein
MIYLACAIGGLALLGAMFQDRLIEVALLVFFTCVLADGLIEGELSYGMRGAKKSYRRKESPVAYWLIVALWCVLIAVMSAALLGLLPRRSADPNRQRTTRGM